LSADITWNTYWDWNLNQVGAAYGAMDEVFKFAATFKDFPPRSYPPGFVPSAIMEQTLHSVRRMRPAVSSARVPPSSRTLNESCGEDEDQCGDGWRLVNKRTR